MAERMRTLPDYLAPGLDIVFVGLNPGLTSVSAGHYFAMPRNRFWPAVNRSGLLRKRLDARNDRLALDQGIGFTDVVKRPSAGSSNLRADDFRRWAPCLRKKIERFQPRIVCFQGVTAYRSYLRYAEGAREQPELGLQSRVIGRSSVFLVPNPSPANAAYSLDTLVCWFRRLKQLRDRLTSPRLAACPQGGQHVKNGGLDTCDSG